MLIENSLINKKILIIGAGNDIGKSLISKLINFEINLVLMYNDEDLIHHNCCVNEDKIQVLKLNYFDLEKIEAQIKLNIEKLSDLSGIVFCDGIGDLRPLNMTKPAHMRKMAEYNCFSFVEIVRCLSKKQFLTDKSSIVAVSSISSVLGLKSKLAYSSSKAALDSAVRSLAAELSNRGIRVNSILKGGLSSDFEIDYIKNVVQFNDGKILERRLLELTSQDELSNLIVFLLSDLVLTITGQNIVLDSGYTL